MTIIPVNNNSTHNEKYNNNSFDNNKNYNKIGKFNWAFTPFVYDSLKTYSLFLCCNYFILKSQIFTPNNQIWIDLPKIHISFSYCYLIILCIFGYWNYIYLVWKTQSGFDLCCMNLGGIRFVISLRLRQKKIKRITTTTLLCHYSYKPDRRRRWVAKTCHFPIRNQ